MRTNLNPARSGIYQIILPTLYVRTAFVLTALWKWTLYPQHWLANSRSDIHRELFAVLQEIPRLQFYMAAGWVMANRWNFLNRKVTYLTTLLFTFLFVAVCVFSFLYQWMKVYYSCGCKESSITFNHKMAAWNRIVPACKVLPEQWKPTGRSRRYLNGRTAGFRATLLSSREFICVHIS